MKKIIFLLSLLFSINPIAQTTISGKITDHKNEPIYGANIYLDGTYDGSSTNEKGEFTFTTSPEGLNVCG
jgi:hypothetical protein